MFERFTREGNAVALRAQDVARLAGSTTTEAEHLLVALAQVPTSPGGRALAELGITEDAVREAVAAEFRAALAVAGVEPPSLAPRRPTTNVRWGQSAKLALERAVAETLAGPGRSIGSAQVLLGVVAAEAGAVPGVLRALGVTPDDVRAATLAPA